MTSFARLLALACFACLVAPGAVHAQEEDGPLPGIKPGPGAGMEDDRPPIKPGQALTAADKCRNECAQEQGKCMTPCALSPGATEPKNQTATMACVTRCGEKSAPCFERCDRQEAAKSSKKGKRGGHP